MKVGSTSTSNSVFVRGTDVGSQKEERKNQSEETERAV